jgi:hypothetical protein
MVKYIVWLMTSRKTPRKLLSPGNRKYRTTQELEYLFFLSHEAQIFFPELNIRLYDKNSESDFKAPNLPLSNENDTYFNWTYSRKIKICWLVREILEQYTKSCYVFVFLFPWMHEKFPHLSVKSIFWSTQMCENVIYFFQWKTMLIRKTSYIW